MKSDIEIAREANMQPIQTVAEKLSITADELDLYGKYKAKLTDELWERIKDRPDGKLVLVTAINPTPAGEGKTTTIVRPLLWIKRWCCRRRLCTGCTDG